MATMTVWLKIDEERVVQALQEAGQKLDSAEAEVCLDFSSVLRIDASGLIALEELASRADDKGVKVALRGVIVSVYKVLKLVKLTSRFSFVN
ncbi:MAG TPA: STAS domain-containing protein [Terriglobales bacterium]|jgi:anti-anti-sigma regulatory factor|nr:STAS domain-containing protein [Terriglobales bacterium]